MQRRRKETGEGTKNTIDEMQDKSGKIKIKERKIFRRKRLGKQVGRNCIYCTVVYESVRVFPKQKTYLGSSSFSSMTVTREAFVSGRLLSASSSSKITADILYSICERHKAFCLVFL